MPSEKLTKISVEELRHGMFVAELDRPWLGTPFLVEGFLITNDKEIRAFRKHCKHVYIDEARSDLETLGTEAGSSPDDASGNGAARARMFPGKALKNYTDSRGFKEEIHEAQTFYQDYEKGVVKLFEGCRNGQPLELGHLKGAVEGICESVVRNPDACMLLHRLRRRDDYSYNHAIGSSIWAAALGRQLGLPEEDIKNLAFGSLLCDVGKIKVPSAILNKPGNLSDWEFEIVQAHVEQGVELVRGCRDVDQSVVEMVAHHHERHDGRGYPDGLKGDEIPVFARIAGIVDCYDAMTSDRVYAAGISPTEAVHILNHMRDKDFQAELIDAFIQTVGIYPCGTLVELSSGEIGIVAAEYRTRRLRPKILLITDPDQEKLAKPVYLDLMEVTEDARGRPLEIARSLEPGAFDFDISGMLG